MAFLTTWEADRGGYFQGTGTAGQIIGGAVDSVLANIGKLPKLPKVDPKKDHWTTWVEGKPPGIDDAWLTAMIQDGRLPSRDKVQYLGNHEERALARVMKGSYVFVEMLDTDRKTRHRCILLGTVLIASRDGWDA